MLDLATIGSVIAARRRALGLKQDELAARSKVSRPTIARLETGTARELGFNKLIRMLAALRLDLRLTDANVGRPTLEDLQREAADRAEEGGERAPAALQPQGTRRKARRRT
jgi:transcriptional regulator with XRE-family HTH domain